MEKVSGDRSTKGGKPALRKLSVRTRKSAPKSRTGCLTCKKKHIRCGEEKPGCQNCIKSGWTCDGYSTNQVVATSFVNSSQSTFNRQESAPRNALTTLISASTQDRQYVYHFRSHSAVDFSGYFGSPFWTKYIPQMCISRPAVLRAVAAVGALHVEHLRSEGFRLSYAEQKALSVYHLGKYHDALQSLNSRIVSDNPEILEETLVCCILFCIYEVLRGENITALLHLKGGLQTLRDLNAKTDGSRLAIERRKRTAHAEFIENIARVFIRFDAGASSVVDGAITGVTLDINDFTVESGSAKDTTLYQNIEDARDGLVKCLSSMWNFVQIVGSQWRYAFPKKIPPEVEDQKQQCMDQLRAWARNFEGLLEKSCSSVSSIEAQSCHILRMAHLTAFIRMSTSLEPEEVVYDQFLESFKEIVQLGTFVLESRHAPKGKSIFMIDIGVIYPLNFTAHKCRCPHTRRKAIGLLKMCGREGAWDGPLFAIAVEKMIEVEESRGSVKAARDVPEDLRVHGLGIEIFRKERMMRLNFSSKASKESQEWVRGDRLIPY